MFVFNSLFQKFMGASSVLFISKFLMLFMAMLFARLLGPEKYGEYSYLLSMCAIFSIPVVSGVHPLLVREISKYKAGNQWGGIKSIVKWSYHYNVIMCLFVLSLISFFYSLNIQLPISIFATVAGVLLIRSFLNLHNAILYGLNNPIIATIPQTIIVPAVCAIALSTYFLLGWDLELEIALVITLTLIGHHIAHQMRPL